jgi:menaquinone-9 beta-reductase
LGQLRLANAGIKLIDNARVRDRMLKALYKKVQGPQHTVK